MGLELAGQRVLVEAVYFNRRFGGTLEEVPTTQHNLTFWVAARQHIVGKSLTLAYFREKECIARFIQSVLSEKRERITVGWPVENFIDSNGSMELE